MTDENNQIPQVPEEPNEVVSWYIPEQSGSEVVCCYVQPTPIPDSVAPVIPAAPVMKQQRKGLTIFLITTAILLAVVATTALLLHLSPKKDNISDSDGSASSIVDITGSGVCNIPTCDTTDSVRMELSAPGEEELTSSAVYEKVLPSTVTVLSSVTGGKTMMGTGVLLTSDGYFVTNAHIVTGCNSCMIATYTGETYEAKMVGYDVEQDIAVLKATDAEGLIPAEFCDSDYCAVGETVYAIGNPLSLNLRCTFTEGIISGIDREVESDGITMTMLQTDAAINNGNSGGPLINAYGQVIGLVTLKMSNTNTSAEATVEGIGFALPTADAAYVVNDLLYTRSFRGIPTFGFTVAAMQATDGNYYVVVQSVEEGSPAQAGGIQIGDVLLAVNGQELHDTWDLLDFRRTVFVGDTVDLTVLRKGVELHCSVTLTGTK